MSIPTTVSIKSGVLILGIVVSAAGLNLSVMQLSEVSEPTEQSAPAPVTQATTNQALVAEPVPDSPALGVALAPPTIEAQPPVATVPVATTSVRFTPNQPAPPTTSTPPPSAAPPPQVSRPTTEYLTYAFDGIADIVVALHEGERMEFWSVVPKPGWSFKVETQTETRIKVKFGFGHEEEHDDGGDDEREDREEEAEFELNLVDGRIRVKAER
jgi:hypothetical protein